MCFDTGINAVVLESSPGRNLKPRLEQRLRSDTFATNFSGRVVGLFYEIKVRQSLQLQRILILDSWTGEVKAKY